MAAEALLEQLLVALGTPKNGEPRRGALLVALTKEGALGEPLCTLTVTATGPLSCDLDPEVLGGAPRGVQELPGAPPNPRPCCRRILTRAQVQRSLQVEFHFCVSVDGNVMSRTLSPETPWAQAGTRLRVQSRHFTGPPCSRLRPCPGPPLPLPVPPPLAAAGFGGDLELLPVSALGPPRDPRRAGTPPLPSANIRPGVLGGLGGDLGCSREPVPPDVTFGVRWDPLEGDGDPQTSPEGDPKTLLVFLFLRHRDPFGGYDAGTRQLLLAQLEPTLRLGRPALARGLRALLHPLLGELRRQHQAQQHVARAQALAVAAVTAVVAASSSGRFRSACLGALQVWGFGGIPPGLGVGLGVSPVSPCSPAGAGHAGAGGGRAPQMGRGLAPAGAAPWG
nr:type 2 DNA topoisomerase 6 subunit B-like [Taeniopygia guttata]